jgi:hypothetical protein
MFKILRLMALPLLLTATAVQSETLCNYRGEADARLTIGQEFYDSRWVVRARVVSATDGVVEAGSADAGSPYTVYDLQVLEVFKGRPSRRIRYFTMRSSGGFPLDRRGQPQPAHDIGGEWLLFLNRIDSFPGRPAAARDAVFVNYNCGQSRGWRDVSSAARLVLSALSRG